ncbi:MAG: alpha-2-macroglobulin family protein, partial [Kiritimatiellia bacterium]|nr:alpha-2-macroglobulin family protein [Kiritimatiellia bacterium]
MMLQVENGPEGFAQFSVEEYKRPKFQVQLTRPTEGVRLAAEAIVPGKATAYTGATIGNAKVQWRVVRNVQFPPWCWWGYRMLPSGRGSSQNIAHGTATTGLDGSFEIRFTALTDRSIPETTEPTFTFEVYADVTDTTGETRSGRQTLRIGYTALTATIQADEWQTPDKPVEWTLGTTSLDGEPKPAEGTVKIYALKQPEKMERAEFPTSPYASAWSRRSRNQNAEPEMDPSNPDSWELADHVAERSFQTDATGQVKIETALPAGIYRAMVETKDRFGKTVTTRKTLQVVDGKSETYPIRLASHFAAPRWKVEAGETFSALWGTGYETGRAYVELEHRGKTLRAFWTGEGRTQELIEQAVGEDLRGGFTVRITYVRENRAYLENRIVDVPWSNKNLTLKWERFTSKLEPGQKETWTAVVTGPDAKRAVAEMVATLYDASLDQILPHNWMQGYSVFRREPERLRSAFANQAVGFSVVQGRWAHKQRPVPPRTYRHYPDELTQNLWRHGGLMGGGRGRGSERSMDSLSKSAEFEGGLPPAPAGAPMAAQDGAMRRNLASGAFDDADKAGLGMELAPGTGPDLDQVSARKNLNETAFFFPHLVSDDDGVVRMEFTMPEALTEWKFMGFVHDRDLRSGFLSGSTVTAKDLMVEPNPPRFVREGDVIEFTVKVSNQSAARQTGQVKLSFTDARTLKNVDAELGLSGQPQSFDIPSKESRSFSWRM